MMEPTPHPQGGNTAQERVLICEDSAEIAKLLKYMLRYGGIEADIANTIAQAKAMLRQYAYSAITLDTYFPDGNGVEFMRELEADMQLRHIPIVMVTGTERHEIEGLLPTALHQWLVKPILQAQLTESVRTAMKSPVA